MRGRGAFRQINDKKQTETSKTQFYKLAAAMLSQKIGIKNVLPRFLQSYYILWLAPGSLRNLAPEQVHSKVNSPKKALN